MRSKQDLLIAGVGIVMAFVWFGLLRSNSQNPSAPSVAHTATNPSVAAGSSLATLETSVPSRRNFKTQLKEEASKVGQLTADPEAVEQGLNEWARSLKSEDFAQIRESIFNDPNIAGDEVALSLDLLGRSQDKSAEALLLEYVLKGPSTATSEKGTFQLLALEGLIDQSLISKDPAALKKVMANTDDALLAKRTAQGLKALEGKAPSPEQTDQKALAELLKRQ